MRDAQNIALPHQLSITDSSRHILSDPVTQGVSVAPIILLIQRRGCVLLRIQSLTKFWRCRSLWLIGRTPICHTAAITTPCLELTSELSHALDAQVQCLTDLSRLFLSRVT